ncbi:MAG TPA: DegT/DnrJ/EryC1/StrS family aminotransferase, partial [Solirubrobacteraceae bacterium]|nr:DegT/DnrJ/EryC1/StrS family aminotransferase [Solirubrobacteraceae bacterium]
RISAKLEERKSPVTKDQDCVPIADAMRDYHERGMLSFGIPAHSGGRGPAPEFTRWLGMGAARFDLPMSHGVDTRDHVWAVQETAQELFAEAVGAQQTLFSTNGSSLSVRVALMAVAGPGEKVIMARNPHKSSVAGLIMSGARPAWIDPVYDEGLEIAHVPTAATVTAALEEHPDAKAVVIFTPSYYGTAADVRAIAEACHERDVPLVTDDAWGLDYALSGHPDLPEGALAQGSDLAIGSVHKTITGLGQTSVLSVGSDRIDTERLNLCFELEKSTSASTLLLSSIDGARRQFVRDGHELLDRAIATARHIRERLAAEVPELKVVSLEELAQRPGVAAVDPTHPLIETWPVGLSGFEADDWIRDERQVDIELVDHRRIMPLVTFAHGIEDGDRLVDALRDLVDEEGSPGEDARMDLPTRPELRTEQAMTPRDAFFAKTELVGPEDAVGRISAELVTPYPPGIPAAVPGEVYTDAIVDYVEQVASAGGYLEGAADSALDQLRVVA